MRFASLGSGSKGNALLIESGGTRILLDCGFGLAELSGRLSRIGRETRDLDAIIVTHEHGDHGGGVARLSARDGVPVYCTRGTYSGLGPDAGAIVGRHFIDAYTPFAIGSIEVTPYTVPHDAREPVQFVIGSGSSRLGVLTDAGMPTPHIVASLSGVDALVIECNHDPEMLENGPYPAQLKRRIAGRLGHLSNQASAEILQAMDRSRLQHVIAAHLSEKNNTPDLARDALAGALDCTPGWIGIATQEEGFAWREIG
jgi:phosphoribosyl 1,2-cyclic phosphodiesterase